MRTPSRVLLAVTAALAAAQPAAANPHASVRAGVERSFETNDGYWYAYDSVGIRFRHHRGGAGAGTHSGGVSGETWEACVTAWGGTSTFYGCGTPTGVTFDVPPGMASGRLKFTLRNSWGYGSAVADLTLTDSGAAPSAGYELHPSYYYGVGATPTAVVSRLAVLKGTVRVTTRRGTRTSTRTYAVTDVPIRLREQVTGGAGAGV